MPRWDYSIMKITTVKLDLVKPTPLLLPVYFPAKFEEQITTYQTSIRYIGIHEFIPGVATNDMNNYLIINEQSYRAFSR